MSETLRFLAQLVLIHLIFSSCFLLLFLLYLESFGRLLRKFIRRVVDHLNFFPLIIPLTKNSSVFLLIRRLPSSLSFFVFKFDVRPVTKEQVGAIGGTFLKIDHA